MDTQPLTVRSWPQAILHLDADAFFASCEQALHPELRGRPVITGKERGIVAAASYEAKAKGIKRGMRLFEVKEVCPEAIILPSDYETYSLFSVRMFGILRRFSPDVEEYSIDEAFVDLTGLRRSFHAPYGLIAQKMQESVETELGFTVSIGVSLSKVLAKIASKYQKPHGLTLIPGRKIHLYLADLPVEKVWGIGPNTAAYLRKLGVTTALEFTRKDEGFVRRHFSKPYLVLNPSWHVPKAILAEEILLALREDPGYLERHQMVVLSGRGNQARQIDPAGINWQEVDHETFSYRIVQKPGPQNPLGRIKFMLPNKYEVYLHDTSSRDLFEREMLAFSHGCIRIEKPFELAQFLLGESWNKEMLRGKSSKGTDVVVPLPKAIDVHIVYLTSWVDEEGVLQFRDDIYGRDILFDTILPRGLTAPNKK